jgi:uncharacterized cupin superfamily protein
MPASSYAFLRELVWVVAGELVLVEGRVRHAMQAGDCLELGPPTDCQFLNETDAPCTYLVAALSVR